MSIPAYNYAILISIYNYISAASVIALNRQGGRLLTDVALTHFDRVCLAA